jgi:hypothetical protein
LRDRSQKKCERARSFAFGVKKTTVHRQNREIDALHDVTS